MDLNKKITFSEIDEENCDDPEIIALLNENKKLKYRLTILKNVNIIMKLIIYVSLYYL